MKTVPFGDTGVSVSHMCLGTMMFAYKTEEDEARKILDMALDHGVNFLDTASMYASGKTEEMLGRLMKGRRDRFFVVTKVNVPDGAEYPTQIVPSLEASLERMQTDHADLYLIHWARKNMNPAAMMGELAKVVKSGKARFVGTSNFPAWLFAHFNAVGERTGAPRLVNNQIPYNLIERGAEVEVLPQAAAENIAITCYRPLMGGALSGKYNAANASLDQTRGAHDDRVPKWAAAHAAGVARLAEIARERNASMSNIAIAWLKAQRGVTCPIIGVTRPAQFVEALAAFDLDLTEDEQTRLMQAFGTEVKEVSDYYGPLRRRFDLLA